MLPPSFEANTTFGRAPFPLHEHLQVFLPSRWPLGPFRVLLGGFCFSCCLKMLLCGTTSAARAEKGHTALWRQTELGQNLELGDHGPSYLISLRFSFLICKLGLITQGCCEAKYNPQRMVDAQKKMVVRNFPGGPVVENPPCNAGDVGSIPGWGTRIPHAAGQLSLRATAAEFAHFNERA